VTIPDAGERDLSSILFEGVFDSAGLPFGSEIASL
jgi:hypothetical protein